jgi:hypothetical protein
MPLSMFTRMTPTSVDKVGGSSTATINADGSVTFSLCEEFALNGVFTSAYDNYMVVLRSTTSAVTDILLRLRAGGSNNTTASSYVSQFLRANSTTVSGLRATDSVGYTGANYNTQRAGTTVYFFGPYLAQPTAWRSITALDLTSAHIEDIAGTHNQSVAYDGFWLDSYAAGSTISGLITVFGFNQ